MYKYNYGLEEVSDYSACVTAFVFHVVSILIAKLLHIMLKLNYDIKINV